MSETNYALELSTEIAPGTKFTVDSQEYQLVNPDHLSEEAEVRMMSKFTMHGRLARQLEAARTEQEAKAIAAKLRLSRIGLIVELTNLEEDVASKLPLQGQAALLRQIQTEMGLDEDDV